jgi:hypothetical protein
MADPLLDLSLAYAHCKAVAIAHGPLLLSMFLAGLIGSASHCAAMCGPFVLAQTSETMTGLKVGSGELRRLAGAALLPYHTGRAVTYILLAVLLSLPLHLMARLPELRFIPAVALVLGALLFLVLGFRGLRGSLEAGELGGGIGAWLGRFAKPLLAKPGGRRGGGHLQPAGGGDEHGGLHARHLSDVVVGRLSRRLGATPVEQVRASDHAGHRAAQRHRARRHGVELDRGVTA